jgi:hypothetical protein
MKGKRDGEKEGEGLIQKPESHEAEIGFLASWLLN